MFFQKILFNLLHAISIVDMISIAKRIVKMDETFLIRCGFEFITSNFMNMNLLITRWGWIWEELFTQILLKKAITKCFLKIEFYSSVWRLSMRNHLSRTSFTNHHKIQSNRRRWTRINQRSSWEHHNKDKHRRRQDKTRNGPRGWRGMVNDRFHWSRNYLWPSATFFPLLLPITIRSNTRSLARKLKSVK